MTFYGNVHIKPHTEIERKRETESEKKGSESMRNISAKDTP